MHEKGCVIMDIRLASIFIVILAVHLVNGEILASSTSDGKVETATPLYSSFYNSAEAVSSENGHPSSNTWRSFDGSKNHVTGSLPMPSGDIMKKVMSKGCSHRYTMTCLKLDVVSLVDRLSQTDKYQLLPGVSVIRDNSSAENGSDEDSSSSRKFPADLVASLARDYPNDVEARLDAFLVHRLGQYLNSHSITVKLFDEESFAKARQLEQQAVEELQELKGDGTQTGRKGGGGGKGGKKGMGQLMMAAMMMKGTLGSIAFGALALLAGKALMTALLSLMLSAIIGLKSLTSSGGKQAVTYEIVQKPVYSHSHSHSHELHHEHLGGHGGGGHGGGGGGGGGGYGHSSYGRSFNLEPGVTFQDEVPQEESNIRQRILQDDVTDRQQERSNRPIQTDAHQMAYSAYVNHGSEIPSPQIAITTRMS